MVQSHDNQLAVWHFSELSRQLSGYKPAVLRGIESGLWTRRLTVTNTSIAAIDSDTNKVLVWSIRDGTMPVSLRSEIKAPDLVKSSAVGDWLAIAGEETLQLWNVGKLDSLERPWSVDLPGDIKSVSFDRECRQLAVAWETEDKSGVELWQLAPEAMPGARMASFDCEGESPGSMTFSPDGLWLCSKSMTSPPRHRQLGARYEWPLLCRLRRGRLCQMMES